MTANVVLLVSILSLISTSLFIIYHGQGSLMQQLSTINAAIFSVNSISTNNISAIEDVLDALNTTNMENVTNLTGIKTAEKIQNLDCIKGLNSSISNIEEPYFIKQGYTIPRYIYQDIDVLIMTAKLTCATMIAIRNILYFQSPRNIYIISPSQICEFISNNNGYFNIYGIKCIPEHQILSYSTVEQFLTKNNFDLDIINEKYTGRINGKWYYQQFLKLLISNLEFISEYYVVYDSDVIPIQGMEWFKYDNNHNIKCNKFSMGGHDYDSYIKTFDKLMMNESIKIVKLQNKYSLICHWMIFRKEYVHQLFGYIIDKHKDTLSFNIWWQIILHFAINENKNKEDKRLGFSEYWTYSSFVANIHSDKVCIDDTKTWIRGDKVVKYNWKLKNYCPSERLLKFYYRDNMEYIGYEMSHKSEVNLINGDNNWFYPMCSI